MIIEKVRFGIVSGADMHGGVAVYDQHFTFDKTVNNDGDYRTTIKIFIFNDMELASTALLLGKRECILYNLWILLEKVQVKPLALCSINTFYASAVSQKKWKVC